MNKMTLSAMALSAFALTGCGEDETLTVGEVQALLDTVIVAIDNEPQSTAMFSSYANTEGECGIVYTQDDKGVELEADYSARVAHSFYGAPVVHRSMNIPYALSVLCDDFDSARKFISTRLDADFIGYTKQGADDLDALLKDKRDTLISKITTEVDVRLEEISKLQTFGLQ